MWKVWSGLELTLARARDKGCGRQPGQGLDRKALEDITLSSSPPLPLACAALGLLGCTG